jgi:hypothetical protein
VLFSAVVTIFPFCNFIPATNPLSTYLLCNM